jgi:hypothetical protein
LVIKFIAIITLTLTNSKFFKGSNAELKEEIGNLSKDKGPKPAEGA